MKKQYMLGAIVLFLTFAGCTNPMVNNILGNKDPPPPPNLVIDTTALEGAIDAAVAARDRVTVASGAGDVAQGVHFVTQEQKAALDAAITAAQDVVDKENPGATQAEVDKALADLNTAIGVFNTAKEGQTGTNEALTDTTALNYAIDAANAAKDGVAVRDDDPANVAQGMVFVTPAELADLNAAIESAQSVADSSASTQAQINAAEDAVKEATTTFTAAKKTGTKEELDTTALNYAIDAANAAKTDVVVINDVSDNVAQGTVFVSTEVMATFNEAIADAQAVVDSSASTQAQINAAEDAVKEATATFNTAKKTGTRTDEGVETGVNIGFNDKGDALDQKTSFVISRTGEQNTKIVTVTGTWDTIQWSVDALDKGIGQSITIDAKDHTIGGHTLSVTVVKDGIPWSQSISFTVIDLID
ncbi:MAG: FIVAR domain-containing protein [Treponema sp.]|jgi:hypothetical protein|nr:FIVAR domain-containing protein [Treponema sp.]